jgi:hypothetical protein
MQGIRDASRLSTKQVFSSACVTRGKLDEKPYSYDDLVQDLVPEVADLVLNEGYQPPLDLNITDNLGRIVACVEMNSQLNFRPTSDTWKLRDDAVLPFLATVVDHKGRVWKKSFGES